MRHAISYVSTAAPNLSQEEIKELLEWSTKSNNEKDITGVLLSSETNFFQLIEGEAKKVKVLFSSIENDPRHTNIIKIIDKPVDITAYDGYICGIITGNTKYNDSKLKNYLHYIEVLDPVARKAVTNVIEAIIDLRE